MVSSPRGFQSIGKADQADTPWLPARSGLKRGGAVNTRQCWHCQLRLKTIVLRNGWVVRYVARLARVVSVIVLGVFCTAPLHAYGPMNHLCVVERRWSEMWPLIQQVGKAGGISQGDARRAAFAGAMSDDLGYYFTSSDSLKLLTNAMHYAKSGDWVTEQLRDAERWQDPRYFAFALGELSHYAADRLGHFYGTNVMAVELAGNQDKYGWRQSYEQGEDIHTEVEAGFDFMAVIGACDPAAVEKIASDLSEERFQYEGVVGSLNKALAIVFPQTNLLVNAVEFEDALRVAYHLFGMTAIAAEELYHLTPQDSTILADITKMMEDYWAHRNQRTDLSFETRWLAKGRKIAQTQSKRGASVLNSSFDAVCEFYSMLLTGTGKAMPDLIKSPLPFPNYNLDTNMPSVSGSYELADQTVEEIVAHAQRQDLIACPPKLFLFNKYFQDGKEQRDLLRRRVGKAGAEVEIPVLLKPIADEFRRVRGETRVDSVPMLSSHIRFVLCAPGTNCVPESESVFAKNTDLRIAAGVVSYTEQTTLADLWLAAVGATILEDITGVTSWNIWVRTVLGEYRFDDLAALNANGYYPSKFCQ
jgi:hypothetical protein